MNILITTRCNKNCDFCFIQDRKNTLKDISLSDYNYCLNFASKSKINMIYLLGGEPTIHPYFKKIVDMTINRNMKITLLSNFLFSKDISEYINRLINKKVFADFLINSDFPTAYNREGYSTFLTNIQNIDCCPTMITLAITLRHIKPLKDYKYVVDYYRKYDISRVRISIDVTKLWYFLGNKQMGRHYYEVVRYFSEHGFIVNSELCAMGRCMFSDYEDRYLRVHCIGYDSLITCQPNLDVFPDLTVRYCASRPKNSFFCVYLKKFTNIAHAKSFFNSMNYFLTLQKTNEDCINCSYIHNNECKLNCLSRFDNYQNSCETEINNNKSISNIYITPLLDRWHVYSIINEKEYSFVVDKMSLEILDYFWNGYSKKEIVQKLVDSYQESNEIVSSDVEEFMSNIGELLEIKYDIK